MLSRPTLLLTALLLVLGVVAPAHAERRVVTDTDSYELPYVAIESAEFVYGRRVVRATVEMTSLTAIDSYGFQARGPRGHTWSVGRGVETGSYFTHFMWPGESADRVKCRARWREDQARRTVSVSFPSSCLRIDGRRVPWIRVTMSALGHGDDGAYLVDFAPGGNSATEAQSSFTGRLRRG